MRTLKRSASTAAILTALASTVAVATAGPASAASYKCTASSKSIDDPAYSGPWADNWDVKVSLCAKRSGSTLYAYAKVTWDGPVMGIADDDTVFDGAYFTLQVKKSQSGPDPVKKAANYHGIEAKLENSTAYANCNGTYATPVLSYKIGSSRGLTDGELHLDWDRDGKGYWQHQFSASPVI